MSLLVLQLAEHPHSNIFLLKTSFLQHITDLIKYSATASIFVFNIFVSFSYLMLYIFGLCSDSSTDSVVRSRASLISGRLLSLADSFVTIDQSCKHDLFCSYYILCLWLY